MKLAASNIAWTPVEDPGAAEALASLGCEGVELAPTAIWAKPLEVEEHELARCRREWASRGLRIVAMQALLYGKPELTIFRDAASREATASYLKGMIRVGAALGAHALVFGSPKNRTVGALTAEQAHRIAVDFFGELGAFAAAAGTCLCIEPNPPAYGCDFVTSAREGLALVEAVASPGFRLHLDAGGMTMVGEAPEEISSAFVQAAHFHASEPQLAPVGTASTDHARFAHALAAAGYSGWVSLEMRSVPGQDNVAQLHRSLELAARAYAPLWNRA